MEFHVYIPARYASTRLPGKPLLDIAGKPLIRHVFDRAVESGARAIIITTDDKRIQDCASAFGATVCMTSSAHRSGTDRLAEAVEILNEDDATIVVNVQGDEPQMPAELIKQVACLIDGPADSEMATLCEPIAEPGQLFDPHVVKVVFNHKGYALYFSRAPIPWHRDEFKGFGATEHLPEASVYYRHIGLYAYRVGFLKRYSRLPPCPLEQAENLEQLRVLYYGFRIRIAVARVPAGTGIDTLADLERVRGMFKVQI